MLAAWSTMKWAVAAVVVVWGVLQLVALKRLRSDRRRRGESLFRLMVATLALSQCIELIFENRCASRVAFTVVGLLGVITSVVLI